MALRATESSPTQGTTCYRHPRRVTNVRCSNCGRPICSDCMRPSPVGMRCPECAPRSRPALNDDMLVTKAIIAICVVVYIAQMISGKSISGGGTLTNNGLLFVPSVYNGQWWRLITSGFMHASVLHIAFNMYFIWAFGQLLEPAFGRVKYALLYLACLLGGSLAVVSFGALTAGTLGASTGGFGLLGAALMVARLRDHRELQQNLIGLAVIQFLFTFFAPGVSIQGHVGGFLTGLLCGYIAFGPLARQRQLTTALLAAVSIACFVGGVAVSNYRVHQYLQSPQQQVIQP